MPTRLVYLIAAAITGALLLADPSSAMPERRHSSGQLELGSAASWLLRADPMSAAGAPDAQDLSPPWLPGGYADYAPSGVPDFSQCRREWSRPGSPGQWTHAGPIALANALWWLDSVYEPAPQAPPVPSDGHPLVTAYPRFGPPRDDHDSENLVPLIEDLALRANTNGARSNDELRGTPWEDMIDAAQTYVSDRRLDAEYTVENTLTPDAGWLATRASRGGTAVLLLGVWEHQGGQWKRVGGHYAALAGVAAGPDAGYSEETPAGEHSTADYARQEPGAEPSSDTGWVALADPLADTAAFGGAGRAEPADPSRHGCRDAPRAHDDAAVVSHDQYELYAVPGLPQQRRALLGYFTPETSGDAAAFRGQNPAQVLAEHEATWLRGSVVMALDGALAIVPRESAALPTATATTDSMATPTPTATPPTPTSSAAGTPTETPEDIASPSTEPRATTSATPDGHATPSPTATGGPVRPPNPRTYLPWLRS